MKNLSELERQVLCKLLEGGSPTLVALRHQLESCSVLERSFTGCGFFTTFDIRIQAEKSELKATFGDVIAELSGLKEGAGFLLYIRNGLLDTLEGYTFDEEWPTVPKLLQLRYRNPTSREWGDLAGAL